MDFIENVWVSEERAEAGFGAEIDRPAAILDARKIGWICIAEFSAAQGDEARRLLLFWRRFRHLNNQAFDAAGDGGSSTCKIIALQQ